MSETEKQHNSPSVTYTSSSVLETYNTIVVTNSGFPTVLSSSQNHAMPVIHNVSLLNLPDVEEVPSHDGEIVLSVLPEPPISLNDIGFSSGLPEKKERSTAADSVWSGWPLWNRLWSRHPIESLNETKHADLEPFLETGSAGRRPGQGRRRATTPNEDRYLVLMARRHRNMNATLLQQHLRSATGTTVSTQTVRNRLHGVGLYARRSMVCVRLTSRHRCDCKEWATEHVNWRRNEWSNVLFSDESRFSVYPDNRRIFIWRDRGSRNKILRLCTKGDEILRPIVVPYTAAIGDDFILMDDNCRPHRANLVEDFLFEEGIVRMEWPACSPDMNPIKHAWDALGRRVAGRQPPPKTLQKLERGLLEE
ncbi:transposable element Tcb2 transposase [Trichonephila clavipes]|uniref:Transposable element Tcb2 transposase n=1 Tax=Trichonephila clavipes TaxID=2585209 RepID=A0A8X6R8E0_TRICX|nr:transposable element Tcb2 transposase [Trichonephila clavipes]